MCEGCCYIPCEIQERRFSNVQLECMGQDPPALLHDISERLGEIVIMSSQGLLIKTHSDLGSTSVVM